MNTEFRNLLISKIIIGMIAGFLLIGLPLYLKELGITTGKIGFVFGIAMFFYAIIGFYMGSRSESNGRLGIGVVSIALMILSIILFGLVSFVKFGLLIFIIAKIIFELAHHILENIVKIRTLDLSKKKNLGDSFGLLIFADSLGYGFGILLGGLILYLIDFETIFFMLSFIMIIPIYFFLKSGDIKKKKEIKLVTKTTFIFKILILINTILIIGGFLVDWFGLPLYQKEVLEMSNQEIFILIGIAWIVYGLFSKMGGSFFDKYGIKSYVISLLLISITSFLLYFVKNVFLFGIIITIDYIFYAFADTSRFAINGKASYQNKGVLSSYFLLYALFFSAFIILFFGKIVEIITFEYIFVIRGIIQIIAAAIILFYYKEINMI